MAEIEFESAPCIICKGVDTVASDTIQWRGEDLHYVICRGCGLKFINPRPTQRWYADFYKNEFWQEKVVNKGFYPAKPQPVVDEEEGTAARLRTQKWRANRIYTLMSSAIVFDRDSVVLDIGCAFGEALRLIHDNHGSRVMGIEPSELSRAYAIEVNKIEMIGRFLEEAVSNPQNHARFDVIVMSHVLENIVDPIAALQLVKKMLKPDGVLYIDACNLYYYNSLNPYHIYLYTPDTLTDLLGVAGLSVSRLFAEPHPREVTKPTDGSFFGVVARPGDVTQPKRGVDVEQLLAHQQHGRELVREYYKKPLLVDLSLRALNKLKATVLGR